MSSSSNSGQRVPLSNNTNSLVPSRSPSPQDVPSKPAVSPAIRRRVSFRKLHPRADSSEDPPSAHSSIFDAPYCSSSEGGDSGERYDAKTSQIRAAVDLGYGEEVSSRACEAPGPNTLSIGLGPRDRWTRLGGTPLETIIERKSITTIRSSVSLPRAHSLDEAISSTSQSPIADVLPVAQARRRHSFSFDDAIRLDTGNRRPSSNTADGILPPPKAYYDYASPNMPIQNRPERIPTPPGLPSWSPSGHPVAPHSGSDTTNANRTTKRRGFLFRSSQRTPPPSGLTVCETSDGLQIANQRQFATAPGGRSRFRPPPSGYRSYGSLDMHPFHRAPIAKPWESTAGSIRRRSPSSRPRITTGYSPTNMQYVQPVLSSTDDATGATPSAPAQTNTNPPAPCPHLKRNRQSGLNQVTDTHPTNYGDIEQQSPAEKCWRCRLTRWTEQFSTFCCGDIGDYDERTGFQNFSAPPLPANPRYNVAGI